MPGNYEEIKLDNINGGQMVALFERELARVLENIGDENTSAKATREISLKVKIRPDETRESATIEIDGHAKLAPVKPSKSYAVFSFDGTTVRAFQSDPRQLTLGVEDTPGNVTPMPAKAAGEGK